MPDVKPPVREKAVRFGKTATLVGVLSGPRGAAPAGPGVLLLNSGVLHHIGACRLHVRIARRLSAAGYPVLRFDHAGIGDSEARKDTLSFVESAPLEVREAMDYLTERAHCREFVLIGLCSGADMAFAVALDDPRAAGLVQMDAYAYRTFRYYVHHYRRRVFKLSPWKGFFTRKVRALFGKRDAVQVIGDEAADYVQPEYRRIFPPKETVAEGLAQLVGRNVQLLNIFTGGQEEHLNHGSQYRDTFRSIDFRDLLQVEFMATADHIFTDLAHQDEVVDHIDRWLTARWPVPETAEVAGAS